MKFGVLDVVGFAKMRVRKVGLCLFIECCLVLALRQSMCA